MCAVSGWGEATPTFPTNSSTCCRYRIHARETLYSPQLGKLGINEGLYFYIYCCLIGSSSSSRWPQSFPRPLTSRLSHRGRSAAADVWGRLGPGRLGCDRRPWAQLLQPVVPSRVKQRAGSSWIISSSLLIVPFCLIRILLYFFILICTKTQTKQKSVFSHKEYLLLSYFRFFAHCLKLPPDLTSWHYLTASIAATTVECADSDVNTWILKEQQYNVVAEQVWDPESSEYLVHMRSIHGAYSTVSIHFYSCIHGQFMNEFCPATWDFSGPT